MSRRGWGLFAVLSVLWGIPYLMIKVAVGELDPAVLVFLRTALAGLALLPLALARGHFAGLRAAWRWVVAFAVIEVAVPWILLGHAEVRLTSSLTALLLASIPMIALLASRVAGLEHQIRPSRWVGLLIGVCGVAAVAGLDVGRGDLLSALLVLLVAVCYATAPLIIALRVPHLSGIGVTTAAMLLTAVLYLPWAVRARPASPGSVSWEVWASVVGLGLLCSAVAFVVFFRLVAEVGPARMSVITYVNPVVAAIAGMLVLDERLTAGLLVGFPLVLLGSYLATRRGGDPVTAPAPA